MCDFQTLNYPHYYGSWDETKNIYTLRHCAISNLATARAPETTQPVAFRFMGPDSCLTGNYVISQWVQVLGIMIIYLAV